MSEQKTIKPFPLLRYFSIASLVSLAIVAIVVGLFYQRLAEDNLVNVGESKNVAITQSLSNSVWVEFSEFLTTAADMSGDEIRAHSETQNVFDHISDQMRGLTVLKVKIYSVDGNTVFSTEFNQIGDDKSENLGFLSAIDGVVDSELTHRDTFSAFEQTIEDRDVISSYVPIIQNGEIVGVFEVYDDVTVLVEQIQQVQVVVFIVIVTIFSALYLLLFFIVRRADRLITEQHIAQEESKEELRATYEALGKETVKVDQTYEALQNESRKVKRTNEFFRSTLNHILDILRRGTTDEEVMSYLTQVKEEFDKLD